MLQGDIYILIDWLYESNEACIKREYFGLPGKIVSESLTLEFYLKSIYTYYGMPAAVVSDCFLILSERI
jgi:hypothetical protein